MEVNDRMNLFDYNTEDLKNSVTSNCFMGACVHINNVSSIKSPKDNSILFIKKEKWNDDYKSEIQDLKGSLIILENGIDLDLEMLSRNNQILITENARLEFAKVLDVILKKNSREKKYQSLENNVVVGENASLGENIILEPFAFIDCNVVIGNNCTIKTGARIRSNVIIGNNVTIGENSVIGAPGFGVEMDLDGQPFRIPHIGGVIIGNNVEVGALNSIVSGTINPTIISDNVMIDDLIHVAHNCTLGKSTMVTSCVELSGSVEIGEKCFLAPHSTIRNGIQIGSESFVGQAASVTKDLPSKSVVAGNPAMDIKRLKKMREFINKSIDEDKGDKQ